MRSGETTERECWRCHAAAGPGLVCLRCAAVQPLARGADLFAVLGLPRQLTLDSADLERRYHEASRAVHPDRYQTGAARERELSLATSAAVNRAYRTLRDPEARGRYWLELHGAGLGSNGAHVPAAIAAEVFETQEKLDELRRAGGAANEALRTEVRALRDEIRARLAALRDVLVASYDAEPALDELRRRLAELSYLRTLLGDVDDALGEDAGGIDRRH